MQQSLARFVEKSLKCLDDPSRITIRNQMRTTLTAQMLVAELRPCTGSKKCKSKGEIESWLEANQLVLMYSQHEFDAVQSRLDGISEHDTALKVFQMTKDVALTYEMEAELSYAIESIKTLDVIQSFY